MDYVKLSKRFSHVTRFFLNPKIVYGKKNRGLGVFVIDGSKSVNAIRQNGCLKPCGFLYPVWNIRKAYLFSYINTGITIT